LIYKKLSNIVYNKAQLKEIAMAVKYSDGYAELGRSVPQEVHPAFNLNNPYVKEITSQFKLPKIFYSCSFIRTKANSTVEPHEDSAAGNIIRTVNILFPLDNYDTPLKFFENETMIDSVDIDSPVAFDCSKMHGYENTSSGWRSAFLLQCKYPFTFEKLIKQGAI